MWIACYTPLTSVASFSPTWKQKVFWFLHPFRGQHYYFHLFNPWFLFFHSLNFCYHLSPGNSSETPWRETYFGWRGRKLEPRSWDFRHSLFLLVFCRTCGLQDSRKTPNQRLLLLCSGLKCAQIRGSCWERRFWFMSLDFELLCGSISLYSMSASWFHQAKCLALSPACVFLQIAGYFFAQNIWSMPQFHLAHALSKSRNLWLWECRTSWELQLRWLSKVPVLEANNPPLRDAFHKVSTHLKI